MHATTIDAISIQMQPFLNCDQMKKLREVLKCTFSQSRPMETKRDEDLVAAFIEAKQVEGCSPKTLDYYRNTLEKLQASLKMSFTQVETADLRSYLTKYERERGSSKVTIDNIRRIMSSFFSWLEEEDYIVKSPVRRIHRVKVALVIKETFLTKISKSSAKVALIAATWLSSTFSSQRECASESSLSSIERILI